MTTQDNVELIQRAYMAIGKGEIPRLIEMMTADVTIQLAGPDEIPFAGTYQGHEGTGQFFLDLVQSATVEHFEPLEFIADDDQVAVTGRERLTARESGRSWETDWVMVWTIRDGQIAAIREFHETAAMAAAFTS